MACRPTVEVEDVEAVTQHEVGGLGGVAVSPVGGVGYTDGEDGGMADEIDAVEGGDADDGFVGGDADAEGNVVAAGFVEVLGAFGLEMDGGGRVGEEADADLGVVVAGGQDVGVGGLDGAQVDALPHGEGIPHWRWTSNSVTLKTIL